MSTPDIRVRLSPEGLKEVIFALRQLQSESSKTTKKAASEVGLISSAVRDLKTLLPTIGLATAVSGMAALGAQAINTADATGKLQQRVGGTVEEISALSLAFRQNESSQEGLQKALLRTSTIIQEVKNESEDTIKALADIGVDASQLPDSAPRALEAIAKALAAIPSASQRAAAATKLFKDRSGELLLALNAVGRQGLDAFVARAKDMGVLITSELADASAAAKDTLTDLKIRLEGIANSFVTGLFSPAENSFAQFKETLLGNVSAVQFFGEQISLVIRAVIGLFLAFGRTVEGIGRVIIATVAGAAEVLDNLVRGNLSGARDALKARAKEIALIFKDTNDNISAAFRVDRPEPKEKVLNPPPTEDDSGANDKAIRAIEKLGDARLAARKAAIQNELKLTKEGLKTQEDATKAAYDQQLLSLRDYFDQRRKITQAETEAEIQALQRERALVIQANAEKLRASQASLQKRAVNGVVPKKTKDQEATEDADRVKVRQDIAALDAQILARQMQGQRELAALEAERTQALKALGEEQEQLAIKLDELEGNRHGVFQRNLDVEIRQIRELGQKAGESAEVTERQVARLKEARSAAFELEEAQKRGSAAFDAFNRDADQIRRDQEAGLITQGQGERRLIELERERLVVMKQLAEQILIAAQRTNDPAQIENAQRFADSVKEIEASYRAATDVVAQFKVGVAEGFEDGVRQLLRSTDEVHNLRDAFESLGDTILNVLKDISSDIIAKQIGKAAESLLGIGSSASSGGGGGAGGFFSFFAKLFGFAKGGRVDAFSTGGLLRGAGTGRSDSIPAIAGRRKRPVRLSNGEFIVQERAVRQPGAVKFLQDFNAMRAPVPLMRAAGGFLSSIPPAAMASAGSGVSKTIQLNLTQRIEAPTQEIGRRTANQAATEAAGLIGNASRRFK